MLGGDKKMDHNAIGTIVGGVVGSNILIRIVWSYLENRNNKKHNPNNHFEVINERLQRILDKLDGMHEDIRGLRK